MTPEEFKAKVDELRTLIVETMVELEDGPEWGSEENRGELADALEELSVQVEAMRDVLREEE
jgi:ClpP class serine protease